MRMLIVSRSLMQEALDETAGRARDTVAATRG
jgi:hypothetical protein